MSRNDDRTIVIGGGLAGMTAAATLADAGHTVTLLESTSHLGGRARSRNKHGFSLNIGPHAVYKAGVGMPILKKLGVTLHGKQPQVWRAGFLVGGEVVPAHRYVRSSVGKTALTLRNSLGSGPRRAHELAGTATARWLDEMSDDPAGRDVVASLLRTANYAADFDLSDAGATTRQLRLGSRGVLYLDDGWQSMVDGFAAILAARGVSVRLSTPVTAVHHDDRVRSVLLSDGTELPANRVVVAVNDARHAASLLDGPGAAAVAAAASATVPVRMAHLDVALRPLPDTRHPNVFGLDQRVYVSVVSDVAKVAPGEGAVISVARYLAPDEEGGDHRLELEAALEAVQPGWSDHAIYMRYTPRSMSAGHHPRVATRGTRGRADADVAGTPGLAIAGDWIGPTGTLADASLRSGYDAALLVAGAGMAVAAAAGTALTEPHRVVSSAR